jgi:hypothetical protein
MRKLWYTMHHQASLAEKKNVFPILEIEGKPSQSFPVVLCCCAAKKERQNLSGETESANAHCR